MLHMSLQLRLEKVISSDGCRSLFMLKVIGCWRISSSGASDVWSWIRHSSWGAAHRFFFKRFKQLLKDKKMPKNWLLRNEMKNMENKFIKRSRKKSRIQSSWLKAVLETEKLELVDLSCLRTPAPKASGVSRISSLYARILGMGSWKASTGRGELKGPT